MMELTRPVRPNLDHLRNRATDLLRAIPAKDSDALPAMERIAERGSLA